MLFPECIKQTEVIIRVNHSFPYCKKWMQVCNANIRPMSTPGEVCGGNLSKGLWQVRRYQVRSQVSYRGVGRGDNAPLF